MSRFTTFLFGVVVGGGLMFGGMKYHLVRAEDGFHLIPKLNPGVQELYVDIREFSVDDWAKHRGLTAAIIQADQEQLIGDSAEQAMRDGIRSALDNITDQVN